MNQALRQAATHGGIGSFFDQISEIMAGDDNSPRFNVYDKTPICHKAHPFKLDATLWPAHSQILDIFQFIFVQPPTHSCAESTAARTACTVE